MARLVSGVYRPGVLVGVGSYGGEHMRPGDYVSLIILVAAILFTLFFSQQRGLEASSLQAQIASLERQVQELKPIPRINVQRASIYPMSGEIVMQTVGNQ